MPIVTFFLSVEATATPGFTDYSSLPETDEESIVVPTFQGIHSVVEYWGVCFRCHLSMGSVQLSWADYIPVIPLFSGWLSVIMLRQLLGMARPSQG